MSRYFRKDGHSVVFFLVYNYLLCSDVLYSNMTETIVFGENQTYKIIQITNIKIQENI